MKPLVSGAPDYAETFQAHVDDIHEKGECTYCGKLRAEEGCPLFTMVKRLRDVQATRSRRPRVFPPPPQPETVAHKRVVVTVDDAASLWALVREMHFTGPCKWCEQEPPRPKAGTLAYCPVYRIGLAMDRADALPPDPAADDDGS